MDKGLSHTPFNTKESWPGLNPKPSPLLIQHAGAGLLGFPSKDLQYRFLSEFVSVFYVRQRDYSKACAHWMQVCGGMLACTECLVVTAPCGDDDCCSPFERTAAKSFSMCPCSLKGAWESGLRVGRADAHARAAERGGCAVHHQLQRLHLP